MNLREPLAIPADRPLDVLIHTRYSTDEQSQSSIDGQINSCQRFLTANLPRECRPEQVNVEIIREPEISGEIADRPGINQVWAGMRDHRWDVILAEESSRLYRHMTFASQFFDTAVDAGIRVICPTDYIDTADEDWPERLHSALGHHGRANHFTRNRIKRAQESRWLSGAAMGPLAIGYKRRPSIPATAGQLSRGPFFDFIDEECKAIIVEIFERTANDEPPWAVADWLTSIKFPKAKNSQKPEWNAGNVISLLRRPIYRGEEVFRTLRRADACRGPQRGRLPLRQLKAVHLLEPGYLSPGTGSPNDSPAGRRCADVGRRRQRPAGGPRSGAACHRRRYRCRASVP